MVQTVDYQAVGLRSRAVIDVAFGAAKLDELYRDKIFGGLLDWRGVSATEATYREDAARSIGRLSVLASRESRQRLIQTCESRLSTLSRKDVEERHGLSLSLASIFGNCVQCLQSRSARGMQNDANDWRELANFTSRWHTLDNTLKISDRDLSSFSLRPELTASGFLALVSSISMCSIYLDMSSSDNVLFSRGQLHSPTASTLGTFRRCLMAVEGKTLEKVRDACKNLESILTKGQRKQVIESWADVSSLTLLMSPSFGALRMSLARSHIC